VATYAEALASFVPDQQRGIEERLDQWRSWRQARVPDDPVVTNLREHERFMELSSFCALLALVLNHLPGDLPSFEQEYESFCRANQRQGGSIERVPVNALLGRAVEHERLVGTLAALGRLTERAAKALAQDLEEGRPPHPERAQVPMSMHQAWVTWDLAGPDVDPFAFSSLDYELICASLALDKRLMEVRPALMLLTYSREEVPPVKRPTVADAAFHAHFRPPPADIQDHGQTRPWPDSLRHRTTPPTSPRPEGVHERGCLSALSPSARVPKPVRRVEYNP
jgi:hypothetical protein